MPINQINFADNKFHIWLIRRSSWGALFTIIVIFLLTDLKTIISLIDRPAGAR